MYNVSVLFVEGNGWCGVAKCGCFVLLIADICVIIVNALYHHCQRFVSLSSIALIAVLSLALIAEGNGYAAC